MPNWCDNEIEIIGPVNKIRALWEQMSKDDDHGLLEALVPMPPELRDTIKGSGDEKQIDRYDGYTNWYDWSVNRWGTKWDINIEGLEYEENDDTATIGGWFNSAWGPPCEAMQTYGHANPDVTIRLDYHEPGMGFVGQLHIENGEDSVDDCVDYAEFDSSSVRFEIGDEMDDLWNISGDMAEWEEYARDEEGDARVREMQEEMLGDEYS